LAGLRNGIRIRICMRAIDIFCGRIDEGGSGSKMFDYVGSAFDICTKGEFRGIRILFR